MPLMPEPPMPTKWTRWNFLNTGELQKVCDPGGRVRTPEEAGGGLHFGDGLRVVQEVADECGQALARERVLLQHAGGARGLHRLRVRLLVVVGGGGEGDEDRGLASDRKLGAGRRSAATHNE